MNCATLQEIEARPPASGWQGGIGIDLGLRSFFWSCDTPTLLTAYLPYQAVNYAPTWRHRQNSQSLL